MPPIVHRWVDLPVQALLDGCLTRTALRSDGALVTFNWFEPYAPCPEPHSHPFDQLSLVLAGTLVFIVDGDELVAGPGTALRIPPGVPHTAYPIGGERVLNVDVFAPAREDYLFLAAHQTEFPAAGAPTTFAFGTAEANRQQISGGNDDDKLPRSADGTPRPADD